MHKQKTFKFYADSGHGWVAVKRNLLTDLSIQDKITQFSYQKGNTVYLEAGCDASTFFVAYGEKHGYDSFITVVKYINNYSPIRSYERYINE